MTWPQPVPLFATLVSTVSHSPPTVDQYRTPLPSLLLSIPLSYLFFSLSPLLFFPSEFIFHLYVFVLFHPRPFRLPRFFPLFPTKTLLYHRAYSTYHWLLFRPLYFSFAHAVFKKRAFLGVSLLELTITRAAYLEFFFFWFFNFDLCIFDYPSIFTMEYRSIRNDLLFFIHCFFEFHEHSRIRLRTVKYISRKGKIRCIRGEDRNVCNRSSIFSRVETRARLELQSGLTGCRIIR